MIKVLVAEDEKPIARNISKVIQEVDADFEVVEIVYNGKQAIEYINKHLVQVVFLDINMPVVDGLSVLKYIREKQLDIIPIILTGYQDFEYAQQALRGQAFEYILKPLEASRVEKLLQQIKNVVLSNLRAKELQLSRYKMESFHFSKHHLGKKCYLGCIYMGSYEDIEEEIRETYDKMEKEIIQYLNALIGDEQYWFIKGKRATERILFVSSDIFSYTQFIEQLQSFIKDLEIPVSIMLTSKLVSIENIKGTYKELSNRLIQNMVLDRSEILIYEQYQTGNVIAESGIKIEKQINSIYQYTSVKILQQIIYSIVYELKTRKQIEHYIKSFFIKVFSCIPAKVEFDIIEEEISFKLHTTYNKSTLFNKYNDILMAYFYYNVEREDNKVYLVNKIKEYIEKNYQSSFSNELLEKKFGYVQSYLREIFKDQVGMSPNSYLIFVRIEKAKEMLAMNRRPKEVALSIGFNDPLYFSKVFKRKTGMAPSEYINSIQSKET